MACRIKISTEKLGIFLHAVKIEAINPQIMVFGEVTKNSNERREVRKAERPKDRESLDQENARIEAERAANAEAAQAAEAEDKAKALELARSIDNKAYDAANEVGVGEDTYEEAKIAVKKAEDEIASLQADLQAVERQAGGFFRRLVRGSNAEINSIKAAILKLEGEVQQLNETVIGPVEGYMDAQKTPDRADDGLKRENARLDAMRNRTTGGTGGFGRK